jgi:hypothetical protein
MTTMAGSKTDGHPAPVWANTSPDTAPCLPFRCALLHSLGVRSITKPVEIRPYYGNSPLISGHPYKAYRAAQKGVAAVR